MPARSSWRTVPVSDVTLATSTRNPRRSPQQPFTYIDVSSVSNVTRSIENPTTLLGADAPSRARKAVSRGDVLFATIRPALQRIAMVTDALDGAVCSTAFAVLRANPEQVDPEFLYYAAISKPFVESVASRQRGSSYPAVSDSDVLGQEIAVPTLDEQRRLVRILSAARRSVAAEEHGLAATLSVKAAFLRDIAGPISAEWREVPLSALATITSGGTPPKSDAGAWLGPVPWVSPKDMKTEILSDVADHISFDAAERFSRVAPRHSILVVVRGMVLAKDIPLCLLDGDMAFNQDVKAIIPAADVVPAFLLMSLLASKERIRPEIGTSAHGTRRLGSKSIEDWPVRLPSRDVQARLADGFMAVIRSEGSVRQAIAAKKALYEALLSDLLDPGEAA
jgi:type I restriction enzyme S subunit